MQRVAKQVSLEDFVSNFAGAWITTMQDALQQIPSPNEKRLGGVPNRTYRGRKMQEQILLLPWNMPWEASLHETSTVLLLGQLPASLATWYYRYTKTSPMLRTRSSSLLFSWAEQPSKIASGCVAWISKSEDEAEWELAGFCCNYCLFGFFQAEMIANMHTFFFLHARFVFKQIILKNSLKLSIHNTHTHTKKGGRQKTGGRNRCWDEQAGSRSSVEQETFRTRAHPRYLRKVLKNSCTFLSIHEGLIKAAVPWKPLLLWHPQTQGNA